MAGVHPLLKLVHPSIDPDHHRATATFAGFAEREADFRPGCTLALGRRPARCRPRCRLSPIRHPPSRHRPRCRPASTRGSCRPRSTARSTNPIRRARARGRRDVARPGDRRTLCARLHCRHAAARLVDDEDRDGRAGRHARRAAQAVARCVGAAARMARQRRSARGHHARRAAADDQRPAIQRGLRRPAVRRRIDAVRARYRAVRVGEAARRDTRRAVVPLERHERDPRARDARGTGRQRRRLPRVTAPRAVRAARDAQRGVRTRCVRHARQRRMYASARDWARFGIAAAGWRGTAAAAAGRCAT